MNWGGEKNEGGVLSLAVVLLCGMICLDNHLSMSVSKSDSRLDGSYIEVGPIRLYGVAEEDRDSVRAALEASTTTSRTLLLKIIGVLVFVVLPVVVSANDTARLENKPSVFPAHSAAR